VILTPIPRPAGQPLQLDEIEAERFDARDESMQLGLVDHVAHQHSFSRGGRHLERVERGHQRGRQLARDPERVLLAHAVLLSGGIAPTVMVGATG
jgi:hypothetical protein